MITVGSNDKEKLIAAYIRCSTEEQNSDLQYRELSKWFESQGIDPETVQWFEDVHTRDDLARPDFIRLDKLIHAGRVKMVVVWKVDRLSGKIADGLNTLTEWLKADARFVSVTQNFDFSGTVGQMIAALLFGIAQMEQETRRERQRAGIAAAKARGGVYTGRRRGATKAGVNTNRAVELRNQDLSYADIGKILGVSTNSARRYCLQHVQ